jgi:hypothetical protein
MLEWRRLEVASNNDARREPVEFTEQAPIMDPEAQ